MHTMTSSYLDDCSAVQRTSGHRRVLALLQRPQTPPPPGAPCACAEAPVRSRADMTLCAHIWAGVTVLRSTGILSTAENLAIFFKTWSLWNLRCHSGFCKHFRHLTRLIYETNTTIIIYIDIPGAFTGCTFADNHALGVGPGTGLGTTVRVWAWQQNYFNVHYIILQFHVILVNIFCFHKLVYQILQKNT